VTIEPKGSIMRRTLIIGAIAATALTVVGVAAGTLRSNGVDTADVKFTATTVENSKTRTCVGADGTYEISYARYTGVAESSNSYLAGPVALRVKSVYNTTKKLGWVEGSFHVRDEGERNGHGRFVAVNTNGVLDGFLSGRVNRQYAAIAGSIVANFSATGGFTNGQIGGGAAGPNTAIIAGQPCEGHSAKPAVRLVVWGTIETLTDTSIGVKPSDGSATQTCAKGTGSPSTAGLSTGKTVKIECAQVNNVMTLVKISSREGDKKHGE
jgi:hypothetical protein